MRAAGEYTSVRVVIGEGKGQNWWCVLFPPLCLPAAEKREELLSDKAKLNAFKDTFKKHGIEGVKTDYASHKEMLDDESLALDVMLLASGAIRNDSLGPVVQVSDLAECFPYDGDVRLLYITGKQLKAMFTYVFRDEVWQGGASGFFQISKRLRVKYDVKQRKISDFLHQQ